MIIFWLWRNPLTTHAKTKKNQEFSFNIEPEKHFETTERIPTPSGSLGRLSGPSLGKKVDQEKLVSTGVKGAAPLGLPPSSSGSEGVTLMDFSKHTTHYPRKYFSRATRLPVSFLRVVPEYMSRKIGLFEQTSKEKNYFPNIAGNCLTIPPERASDMVRMWVYNVSYAVTSAG
jgi:hypothetical protein